MSNFQFMITPGGLESILNGQESLAQRKRQAQKIKAAWRDNIHNLTGATDESIDVDVRGTEVIVSADTNRNPESAWAYLEYGTSKMRAQAPGRRAIRGGI